MRESGVTGLADLRAVIATRGLLRDGAMVSHRGSKFTWMFDLRPLLLDQDFLYGVASAFWDTMAREMPFQVAGIEMAGAPLVTAIQLVARERGIEVNGLLVRKKAKKSGTQRLVEGEPIPGLPVVAVDDSANSYGSLGQLLAATQSLRLAVSTTWCIVSFTGGPPEVWPGVEHRHLFLARDLGVEPGTPPAFATWREVWRFEPENPNLYYAVSKSQVVLDETRLYFGTDSGAFYCLDQATGMICWTFDTGARGGKGIWSTPCIYGDSVIFGAYNGRLYRLRRRDGHVCWVNDGATWIGSSPIVCRGLVWCGLEWNTPAFPGGMGVFDPATGQRRGTIRLNAVQHGSGATDGEHVYFGTNDGRVICCDGGTGSERWRHDAGGAVKYPPAVGDGFVVFGSFDGSVRALHADSGELAHKVETADLVYATPLIHEGVAYVGSSDHNLVVLDLRTGESHLIDFGEKIHSSPVMIGGEVVFGTSGGLLVGLDPASLIVTARTHLPARATERVGYGNELYFVKTYDNVLRAMRRVDVGLRAPSGTVVRHG